jgi:hypothetical protein
MRSQNLHAIRLNIIRESRQNAPVPRVVLLALVALVLAVPAAAAGKSHTETLVLGIAQHGTVRTPHPPLGDAGDVFTTTLLLSNTTAALGKPAKASVGAMTFQYVLHGTCSTESCAGATADIVATSRLPGGTIVATANGVKLGRPPILVPITRGTGAFKGVTGMLAVGAASSPINTYKLKLP